MKQLFAGIVIILVLGLGAFFYRNEVERPLTKNVPLPSMATTTPSPQITASSTVEQQASSTNSHKTPQQASTTLQVS